MLTETMVATALLEQVARNTKQLTNTQAWCKKVIDLEDKLGRDCVVSKWDINCRIKLDKKELSAVRKIVGRLKMTGKHLGSSVPGKETVQVNLIPMSKDWEPLEFSYDVKYRAGKCQIVEELGMSYKTLVCKV